jgi:hypothetical protein
VSSLAKQSDTISPFAIAGEALAINARSTPRLKRFLELYPAKDGNISKAAKAAGIERKTHYRALEQDPHYREAFNCVQRQVGEDLEACAIQLAKEGNAQIMGMLLKRFLVEEYARVTDGVQVNISLTQRMEEANQRLVEMYPAADAEGTP